MNRNTQAKIFCGAQNLLDLERDTGHIIPKGMSREEFVADIAKRCTNVRPCPLIHCWVEKAWCVEKCECLIKALDEHTGEVIREGRGWDGVADEMARIERRGQQMSKQRGRR